MALVEELPDFVENSLRELREKEEPTEALPAPPQVLDEALTNGNGAKAALLGTATTHAVVAVLAPASNGGNATEDPKGEAEEPSAMEAEKTGNEEGAEAPRRISFATDINAAGTFGPEWLVIENRQLYVFAPNGGQRAHLLHAVPLSTIREAKAEMHVGNGLLEVRTDTETIPLIRFSHATVSAANTVARQINALAKGQTPRQEKVEEKRKHCPQCKRVLPEDTEVCPACLNKRAVMLRLFQFIAPYKKQVAASIVFLIAATCVELAPPYIGGRIVDTLSPHVHPVTKVLMRPDPVGAFHTLTLLIGCLALARVLGAGIIYGQRRLNPWLGGRVTMDIRVALYNKFNQLSLAYYDKRSTGSMMSRVTNDADNLWDFIAEGIPWLLTNVMMLFGIGTVLFRLNWQLAFLMLAPAPFIYALTSWFMPRARRKWHHVWHRISKMYANLSSTLTGMRVVKAFAQEDREIDQFTNRNRRVFEASYAANAFWASYWPVLGLLMSTGTYIIYLFGGHKVLEGQMTVGTLTMFIGYLGQFYAPFQNFSRVVDWSTRSLTAAERVFEILDTVPDIQEAKDARAMPHIQGAVEFEDVAFTYDKAKRVLEDFTLKVEPGEMIGLVGHSGAGKSTIINLLSRFYDVTEGVVKIDGVDVRQISQEDFRHQLGIVLQEPFLFPGTIRDNIAYAKPDATVEEIMRAAKAANCHNFIMKFPDGYDTQAGERGQRLSGGERQRISIARAILHDPKILILDEATASVDTETEKQIQEAIARLIQNRTTFAIAHRLSTLRNASRLVVMKEGKMVECGTHDELMEQDGVYANLVKIQNEVNKIKAI
jgi:ATP-binding cassette subfamily B protein